MSKITKQDLQKAKKFFELYEKLDPEVQLGQLSQVAAEVKVNPMEALRWAFVVRPASIKEGGNWPFSAAIPKTVSPLDSVAEAVVTKDREEEEEVVSLREYNKGSNPFFKTEIETSTRLTTKAAYLADQDKYLITLDNTKPPVLIPLSLHRQAASLYSNWDGIPVKTDDVAKFLGLTPTEFMRYRNMFGWTRDMLPEECSAMLQNHDLEEVAEVNARRQAQAKLQQASQTLVERDAQKWRNFRVAVVEEFEAVAKRAVAPAPIKVSKTKNNSGGDQLILALNDWQVGSYADGKQLRFGRQFDKDVLGLMVDSYITQLTNYVNETTHKFGTPHVTLLGDILHGMVGKTVHNTELTKHMREFDWEQAEVALEQLYKICDVVVDLFGSFHLTSLVGNHDGGDASLLGEVLYQRYRHLGVTKNIPKSRTSHMMIQNSLFVFDHGASGDSQTKGGKIPRGGPGRDVMIKDLIYTRPDLVHEAKTKRGGIYFVMGDQHHSVDESGTGFELVKLPAITSGDVYADENGWYSRPAQGIIRVGPSGLKHYERIYLDGTDVFPE